MSTSKIRTRSKMISDYNAKYPYQFVDAVERIKHYFSENNLNLEKACAKARKKAVKIMEERSYKTIHILLYEYPVQSHRPRVTGTGHIYSPNAGENKKYFQTNLSRAVKTISDSLHMVASPAEVKIDAYLEMPSTVTPDEIILFEAKILHPASKPDFDNLEKSYIDMIVDSIMLDDDLFYHGELTKYYSLLPRVEMWISYPDKIESDYVYKKIKSRKSVKAGMSTGQIILNKIS